MSKLYTKEQLEKAIQLARECEHDCGGVYFYCTEIEEVIEELTPIQLPTYDEIEKESYQMDYGGGSEGWFFRQGAKWMRDKIQGGENE